VHCPTTPDLANPPPLITVGADYLLWWVKQQNFPPLVTIGSPADTVPGALGQPGTGEQLGGTVSDDPYSGVRAYFGIGIDRDSCGSLDGNFIYLGQRSPRHTFSSTGDITTAVLTRPFFNADAGMEDADPAAFPSIAAGAIQVTTSTRVWGGDLNMRYHYLQNSDGSRLVLLLGYRYLQVDESLNITMLSQDLPAQGDSGFGFFSTEGISTRNRFNGVQAGFEYEDHVGIIFLQVAGKAAIGDVTQTVNSSALTTLSDVTGTLFTAPNVGLFVSPNNAGMFSRTRLAAVLEGNARVGIDFNENVRLTVGYTFLCLTDAVRPGSQLDRNVSVQAVNFPGTINSPPGFSFHSTTFWAHGLDVGLRFNF
jgi:hypothetical protein